MSDSSESEFSDSEINKSVSKISDSDRSKYVKNDSHESDDSIESENKIKDELNTEKVTFKDLVRFKNKNHVH